jgi:hypothetical protein
MRPVWVIQNIRREAQRRAQEHSPPPEESGIATAPCAQVSADEEAARDEAPPPKGKGKLCYLIGSIVACLIIGAAVGVGVALGSKHKTNNVVYFSPFGPFTTDCNSLFGQTHPNFMSQCHCNGLISTVASDVSARYSVLTETFITTIFPYFHESIDSCTPHNQALVWLASDDGGLDAATMRQRYLLALLFIDWDGPNWEPNIGWLSATEECTWNGVTCDTYHNVVNIDLQERNLNGDFGSDVALLTSLTSLVLDVNNLQGTLPTELANLSNLLELSVNLNFLTGSIPSEYGKMLQLTALLLSNNLLHGSIPTELGMLSRLEKLRLSNNLMDGTIPTELGKLFQVQEIALDNNTFTGKVPTEIGQLHSVELMDFSLNNFFGSTFPSEVGLLTSLTSLLLLSSQINGTLPEEIFRIKGLKEILVTGNNFNGTISTLVGKLPLLSK